MLLCAISCVAWFSDVRGREAKGTANDLGPLRIRLLVVQSNLHTLIVLSFSFYYRLRQKEVEKKLNRPAKLKNEFESNLCKETSWFLTMEDQKTVCLFRFQNIWLHQSNSPTKTWGRQRLKIFWRQRLCWLVNYVNTNLPWPQFLTLVIQGRERIVFLAQLVFFSVFSVMFSSVTPSLMHKLISCVSWGGIKDRTWFW